MSTPKRTLTPAELRRFRKRVGLTQAGLAVELGLTQQMLGHYETGLHAVTPRTILQLDALARKWKVDGPRTHPRKVTL